MTGNKYPGPGGGGGGGTSLSQHMMYGGMYLVPLQWTVVGVSFSYAPC